MRVDEVFEHIEGHHGDHRHVQSSHRIVQRWGEAFVVSQIEATGGEAASVGCRVIALINR